MSSNKSLSQNHDQNEDAQNKKQLNKQGIWN